MTDSNLFRLSYVPEATLGTTPTISGSTQMRTGRIVGESLQHSIQNVISEELRSDRQVPDIIQVAGQTGGGVNWEMSHPLHRTFHSDMLEAALFGTWDNIAVKHNLVADTELANVAAGTGVYTVDAGGSSFLAQHLVMASGFTNTANNGVFLATASTTTTVTTGNSSSVLEAAPPLGAKLEVIGVQGTSGDIATSITGGNKITSTTMNFVSMGFKVGDFVKIGDASNAAFSFATTALNTYVRLIDVQANAMIVDALPTGVSWSADAGTGKTIRIFRADRLKNGVTKRSFTIERGYLGQAVPSYLVHKGLMVNELGLNFQAGSITRGNYNYLGMTHTTSTSSLGSPEAASLEDVLSAGANVADLLEDDVSQASPNLVNSLSIQLSNNLRLQQAIGTINGVGIGTGRCEVTGSLNAYFGSKSLYDKYVSGEETSVYVRQFSTIPTSISATGSRCFVVGIPKMEYESGSAQVGQSNSDVFAQLGFRAKRHPTFDATIMLHRFNYVN